MKIDDALMERLLSIARLDLTPEARRKMKEELTTMVQWLDQLNEVAVEETRPLVSISHEANTLREDHPEPPLSVEQVLKNAPEKSGQYFQTPAVKK